MRDSAADARRRLVLARRLFDEGRPEDAVALAETALAVLERGLGPNNPDAAAACVELSIYHERLSQYDRAERYARRSNVITEMYPRTDETLLRLRVQALGRLAGIERIRDRLGSAEVLYRSALQLVEDGTWPTVSEVVALMTGLGEVYRYAGRYEEAEAIYRQGLTMIGPDHLTSASLWHNLGELERARGDYSLGEPYARRALVLRIRSLGPDHALVADDRAGLAAILAGQGKFEEAELLYRQALATYERVFPPDNFELAVACNDFGVMQAARGRTSEAGRLYRRSIDIKRKLLGRDHPEVQVTLENIANLHPLG
jgi:tetratricopeptide (TPR) repeat protein